MFHKLKIKCIIRRFLESAELLLIAFISRFHSSGDGRTVYVMQSSHLGDFLVSLNFFQRLRKHFCDAELVFISDQNIRELAEASGIFDRFIALDMRRCSGYRHIFYRWKVFRQLGRLSGKAFIQCFGVGATNFEDCAALLVKAPEKYVFVDSPYNVLRSGVIYEGLRTKFFKHTLPYRLEKSLLWNENNFADFITGQTEPVQVGNLEMFEPLPERDRSLGEYAMFVVGADDPRRRWEPEKFAQAAEKFLQTNPTKKIFFSGSPAEQKIIAAVIAQIPKELHNQIITRTPEKNYLQAIKRLMSDCKYAELVVVGETGPLHIAAKYKTRCYCLCGGWHYGVFAPCEEYENTKFIYNKMTCYRCGSFCKYNTIPFRCLQELSISAFSI